MIHFLKTQIIGLEIQHSPKGDGIGIFAFLAKFCNYYTSLLLLWRNSGKAEKGTEFAPGRCKGVTVLCDIEKAPFQHFALQSVHL